MSTQSGSETDYALNLANKVLDRPWADPDDDLAVLARQLVIAHEKLSEARASVGVLASLLAPFAEEAENYEEDVPDDFPLFAKDEDGEIIESALRVSHLRTARHKVDPASATSVLDDVRRKALEGAANEADEYATRMWQVAESRRDQGMFTDAYQHEAAREACKVIAELIRALAKLPGKTT